MRLVAALVVLVPMAATAEPVTRPQPQLRWSRDSLPPAAAPSSRIIYVHKCPLQGCTIRPGTNDSRTDTSDIPSQQVVITQFKQSQAVWDKMMACVKNTYAPFDITVTDVDPGPTVPHYENIVGGSSGTELDPGLGGAGGVSPFTCDEIPNSVSFTFDVYGPDPDQLCWTVAQETAHSFGLEHEYNANDPLTYISGGPSMKRFQATDSPCGTFQPVMCKCTNKPTQNSYKFIVDMFGPGAATPPSVSIRSPSNGGKVQPKFVLRANATDDVKVEEVQLFIDGMDTGVRDPDPPYLLVAPDNVTDGPHTIEARAIDVAGVPASATVDVTMGPPCDGDGDCSGDDVCVMGVCLAGPDVPGGVGDSCTAPTECLYARCEGETNDKQCVASCEVGAANACPSDFSCIPAGAAGVCWYSPSGGCCSANTQPGGPLLLSAGVLAAIGFRRRRRR